MAFHFFFLCKKERSTLLEIVSCILSSLFLIVMLCVTSLADLTPTAQKVVPSVLSILDGIKKRVKKQHSW